MAKVFQIVNNMCYWLTPYTSVSDTTGKYPADCIFVEAPDYVHESWGYRDTDDDGNPITGDDRFIKPTPPEGFVYDDETGTFYPEDEIPRMLERIQDSKQSENKARFAEYLDSHPLSWIDGKVYGCSIEDQTEIQLNISQYQIQVAAGVENPVLEWHAQHEACTPWTLENLSALVLAIADHVYPWFQVMNKYKEQIYTATTKEEVAAIELIYKDPDETTDSTTDSTEATTDEASKEDA